MATLPTVEQVREWIGVSETSLSNDQLQTVYDGEDAAQREVCRVEDPPDRNSDLVEAFYRRVARAVAARGIPLGSTPGNEEFGPTRLASFDGEIERLEGPHRTFNVG